MRSDLTNNPNVLFLFGDNTKRRGLGGQAKEMRGEPNACGIATKALPSQMDNSYFSDADFLGNAKIIAADFRRAFAHRETGELIILPTDGLGTGLSELPERAPQTNEFLLWLILLLESGREPAWKQLLNGDFNDDYQSRLVD
jgi:hypothetical protein